MDQKKIGRFIALARKEKGLTQTELGELLGVTNKTISRWENGNYMPDLSLISTLCNELDISINEFLSGERIELYDDYYEYAENNILSILENEERLKKQKRTGAFFSGTGTGLLASMLYAPDTARKAIIIIVSVAMIFTGWFFRSLFDKSIISSKNQLPNSSD